MSQFKGYNNLISPTPTPLLISNNIGTFPPLTVQLCRLGSNLNTLIVKRHSRGILESAESSCNLEMAKEKYS